jgi:hypothetical protein
MHRIDINLKELDATGVAKDRLKSCDPHAIRSDEPHPLARRACTLVHFLHNLCSGC